MKKESYGLLEGWISVIINIILFALKYWAGVVTGSVALIADAWHTLSDSVSSAIVIIGSKISAKPADEEHPFGHGRAELISALFIGVMLCVIAFSFFVQALEKFNNHEAAIFGLPAIVVTVISIVAKEGMAQFAFYTYRKTKYNSLKADGWHHRSDAISSVVILVGILIGKYYWWADSLLASIVALLILYTAYKIITDVISPLLGETPEEGLHDKIRALSNGVAGTDTAVHHLHIHRYGHHTEITFHIKLDKRMNLDEAHRVATAIERQVQQELGFEATIHVEPDHGAQ